MVEIFFSYLLQYSSPLPHVAVEHLQYSNCEWEIEILILINLTLNGNNYIQLYF